VTVLASPLIIAAHVAVLPTLTGWAGVPVYEGAALRRDDVDEYLTVGYVAGADDPQVSLEVVPHADGTTREAGTLACQLITAQADVATARARVFDLVAPWSAWLLRDRTLGGVLLPQSTAHLLVDVALATTRSGATANALVTVTYQATTYG
jgi:hypothetical protein